MKKQRNTRISIVVVVVVVEDEEEDEKIYIHNINLCEEEKKKEKNYKKTWPDVPPLVSGILFFASGHVLPKKKLYISLFSSGFCSSLYSRARKYIFLNV